MMQSLLMAYLLLCTGESVDPGRREALLKFVKHDNGKTPIGVIILNILNLL